MHGPGSTALLQVSKWWDDGGGEAIGISIHNSQSEIPHPTFVVSIQVRTQKPRVRPYIPLTFGFGFEFEITQRVGKNGIYFWNLVQDSLLFSHFILILI
jgi:hypothetical protein